MAVETRPEDVLRATLSDDGDLTSFIHDGGADLLSIDFNVEDSEKFSFSSIEAAKEFAAKRFGVSEEAWS